MTGSVQPNPGDEPSIDELFRVYSRAWGESQQAGGYVPDNIKAGIAAVAARVSAPTPDRDELSNAERQIIAHALDEYYFQATDAEDEGSAPVEGYSGMVANLAARIGGARSVILAGVGGVPAEPQPATLVAEPPCSCLCHRHPDQFSAHMVPCCGAGAVPQDREAGQ